MNSMMELSHMIISFVVDKAALLSTLPILIAMPMRSRSKRSKPLKDRILLLQTLVSKTLVSLTLASQRRLKPNSIKHESKRRNVRLSIICLIGCLPLVSCTGSTYSSHFDCPMGEGAGCASISRVNKMIDRQEIDLVEGRLPGNDDVPLSRGPGVNQCQGLPSAHANQVYVYYGPDQLGRLISAEDLTLPTAQGGN